MSWHGYTFHITGPMWTVDPWWRHQMETFSALLAICKGNSPVPGEFPAQRSVTRSCDFFDLLPNKRLSKQSWGWWFYTSSRSLNVIVMLYHRLSVVEHVDCSCVASCDGRLNTQPSDRWYKISNYMQLFNVNEITYPCPDIDVTLTNPLSERSLGLKNKWWYFTD